MQRGDGVIWVALISALLIVGIVALVLVNGNPTGEVYAIQEFIPVASPQMCGKVVCDGYQPAYFLGMKGNFAGCCCPEHYKGGRMGWCTDPAYVAV